MKFHITERALNDMVVPAGKKYLLAFDTEQTGFAGLKTDKGSISYVIVYRDANNKQRQEKLASVPDVSATAARELAKLRLAAISTMNQESPKGQRRKSMPSMDDFFFNTFLPIVKANSRSYATHASLYRNHVQDVFGPRRLDEIGEQDILEFKSHLEAKTVADGRWAKQAEQRLAEGTVKRILILVRHIFNTAIRDKAVPIQANPTQGVQLTTIRKVKGRYLTQVQLGRLLKAAEASDNGDLADIIRVLGSTGLRRENVLAMQCSWFNAERGTLAVPDWADKAKKGFTLQLSGGVVELLQRRQAMGSGVWFFANPKTGKPYCSCRGAWVTACLLADLEGLRVHDLRHTYASMMLDSGSDIVDVQQALGHTQLKTTAVYLHLRDERKRDNANAAARATGLFM